MNYAPLSFAVLAVHCVSFAHSQPLQQRVDAALPAANSYGVRIADQEIKLPPGEIRITAPLQIRDAWGLQLVGSGINTRIVADFDAPLGAAIELVGSNYCDLVGLTVTVAPGRHVGYGLFAARDPGDAPRSAGNHLIQRIFFEGFDVAGCANVASECNLYQHCYFQQPNNAAALLVANGGLPELGVPHGVSTMLECTWQDCVFVSQSPSSTAPLIRIVQNGQAHVGNLNFRGGGLGCAGPLAAAVSLEAPGAPGQLQDVLFDGVRWETEPALHATQCLASSSWKPPAASTTAAFVHTLAPGAPGVTVVSLGASQRSGVAAESAPPQRTFTRISLVNSTVTCCAEAIYAPGQQLANWQVANLDAYIGPSAWQQRLARPAIVAGSIVGPLNWPLGTQSYRWNLQQLPQELPAPGS